MNGNSVVSNKEKNGVSKREEIKLKCPNKNCKATLNLENYEMHLNRCDFQVFICIECTYEGNYYEIKDHIKYKCEKIFTQCEFCREYFPVSQILVHIKKCDYQPEVCSLCEENVVKKFLIRHQETTCKKNIVECDTCLFKYHINKIDEHRAKNYECRINIINNTKKEIKEKLEADIKYLYVGMKSLGKMYVKFKKYDEAIITFSKLLSIYNFYDKIDSSLKSSNLPLSLINQTNVPDDNHLSEVNLTLNENSVRKKIDTGTNNEFKETLRVFRSCKEIIKFSNQDKTESSCDLEKTEIYSLLGDTHMCLNNINSAKDCYKKAINNDQSNHQACNSLGDIYFSLGDLKQAKSYYLKAIRSNENISRYHFNLGGVNHELENYEEAISNFTKSILLDPLFSSSYTSLGDIYFNQSKYTEACKYYKKAIELNPNDKDTYLNLGDSLLEIHKYVSACDCYKQAILLDSSCKEAYCHMGNAYYQLTNYEESKECYKKALRLDPSYREAAVNLNILSKY